MNPPELIWQEQCDAAIEIRERFGMDNALDYLVGEKFVGYLRYAAMNEKVKAQIQPFADRIKVLFDAWLLKAWFEKKRQHKVEIDYDPFEDPELDVEDEAEFVAVNGFGNMYAMEDAEKWLLGK